MTMAIPAMPIVVMLALEYGVAEDYAPSILLISTLASPAHGRRIHGDDDLGEIGQATS